MYKLSHYLNYKLVCLDTIYKQKWILTGITKHGLYFDGRTFESREDQSCIKPILKNIKDLSKTQFSDIYNLIQNSSCPEELNQFEACLFQKLDNGTEIKLHYLSYRIIQILLENHFDIFGLIEAGLAVDFNKV